jgi:uncharacterized membrane protein YgcG
MSEFHDPDLRHELDRLSGPYPDDNAAFAAWQRRIGQARRRRSVAWVTGAAMALIVATVGVAALQQPSRRSLVPGRSTETSPLFTSTTPTTEQESSTTESTVVVTSAPTTAAPVTTASSAPAVESSLPEPEATAAAESPAGGTTSKGHGTSPTATPDVSEPKIQTFSSAGGNITVRQKGEWLTVVGIDPADGFHADQDRRSGRQVRVTFRSGDHRFIITVKVSDGIMKDQVSEEVETRHDTVPDDGYGDNPGGGDDDGGGYGGDRGDGGYGGGGGDGGGGYSGGGER